MHYSQEREETDVKLSLTQQRRASPRRPEGVLALENSWFRSQLISITFCGVMMKEGIILEALAATIIMVSKEIGVAVLIIFKCRPSHWVAMSLFGSISHILHLSNMVFEFFLHHIQYNVTIPITPWSSNTGKQSKGETRKIPDSGKALWSNVWYITQFFKALPLPFSSRAIPLIWTDHLNDPNCDNL